MKWSSSTGEEGDRGSASGSTGPTESASRIEQIVDRFAYEVSGEGIHPATVGDFPPRRRAARGRDGCRPAPVGTFQHYANGHCPQMASDHNLAHKVADRAELESEGEAVPIVRAVTSAMAGFFGAEAWNVIRPRVPQQLIGDSAPDPDPDERTVKDFFLQVGEGTGLGTGEAAQYSRIVAEALAADMGPEELDRLAEALDDDFLALFEVDHRGELTEPDGATPGARTIGWPDEHPERYR